MLNENELCLLQHASNLEQKQNETENKKVHGDVVKYGTVMQVNGLSLHQIKDRTKVYGDLCTVQNEIVKKVTK